MQKGLWRRWIYGLGFILACTLSIWLGPLPLKAQDAPTPIAAPNVSPSPPSPIDIDRHWARDCILGLSQRGIITADAQGYFYPDQRVTWQEFTQVLNFVFPTGTAAGWANPLEQALGLENGANVASHYPSQYYLPERPISRAEAVMALAAKIGAPFLTRAQATLAANLTDADRIPSYALEGVAAALPRELILDYPDPRQLRPNDLITRGETAAMLCQASPDLELKALIPDVAIATFKLPDASPLPTTERRGVWLTNIDSQVLFSEANLSEAVDRLAGLNFNTLYPTVWNWGYTLYPSQVAVRELGAGQHLQGETGPPRNPSAPERDMLQELVELAHAQNMQVIPWFEFGFMTPAPYILYDRHPDWFTQRYVPPQPELPLDTETPNGHTSPNRNVPPQNGDATQDPGIWLEGGTIPRRWLNPFHPQAQKFLLELIDELLTNYEIDGVQVDDHLGLPVEFGYDDYTIRLYTQETGAPPPADPRDEAWVSWRASKISDFMDAFHQLVENRRPEAKVSVSPNPYPFAYTNYLQDWPEWERRGSVDELVVQLYRDDQNRFIWEMAKPSMQDSRERVLTSVGILSGLRALPVSMPWIRAQIEAVRDRNFHGMSFFFYETLWLGPESSESRTASLKEAFSNLASPPQVRG